MKRLHAEIPDELHERVMDTASKIRVRGMAGPRNATGEATKPSVPA